MSSRVTAFRMGWVPITSALFFLLPRRKHLIGLSHIHVIYGDSWTVKKAERQRIGGFELWCWRRLLRVPWTARRSNHLIFCYPLLLPSMFPSIRVFSNESVLCITWPKYWSFSFSICPSNKYSGLIFFRMNWLNLLPVQGTFKSLLKDHGSKPSILQCSTFFIVQLSHPYMTTGKKT